MHAARVTAEFLLWPSAKNCAIATTLNTTTSGNNRLFISLVRLLIW